MAFVSTMLCLAALSQAQETRKMQVFYGGKVIFAQDVKQVDSINFLLETNEEKTDSTNYTETIDDLHFRMDMVGVKGGTFTMGCTSDQALTCNHNGETTQTVTLTNYHISKYEITQGQWKAIMGINPSWSFANDSLPVEYVTWNQAKEFCEKLSAKTGKKYVLPTEAQWEFAARGGTKSKGYKYSGSNNLGDVAWQAENSYSLGASHADYGTHVVGKKAPNELGIYDMTGNVWEWCADLETGSNRVIRGLSWINDASYCRVSARHHLDPDIRGNNLGFRVVMIP